MPKETTLDDILEIVTFIKDNSVTKVEFEELEQDVNHIKNVMVTKDYLDNKLVDLRGDLTVLMRKEDTKLKTLIEILLERNVLNKTDAERVLNLEPFPSSSL